jgi:hypothetical protein
MSGTSATGSQSAVAGVPGAGDGSEHASGVPLAVDGDPSTGWATEVSGALNKTGVGLYADAADAAVQARLTLKSRW